ncbi:MAG TPA: carbamoyltransferase N-terminal domain-containing protein [Candidatus Eisenbacteria bacterium]|jgi:carbamoyltransferase
MNVLGISCFYHDSAAALVRDGMLIAAAEEERFSRIKHDFGFPTEAIAFCLEQGGIRAEDLDYVVYYEKPFLKFERILSSSLQTFPRSYEVFREGMVAWLSEKLWVQNLITDRMGVRADRVLAIDHHASHAASAFFSSPFEDAAILTVDGVGEWATATFGVGNGNHLSLTREIRFPHSLGLLYSAFTAFLGFEVNEGEYKVMGMAPYGKPRYTEKVWKLIQLGDDGSFRLAMEYFSFHYSARHTYNHRFVELFGPERPPAMHFFTRESGYPSYFGEKPADYEQLADRNQYYADIASSIQRVTEEVLLHMARALHRETGQKRLCMAGGVALNSVANGRILRETPFEELYVQPAAGDGGGALGAALYGYHQLLGQPRRFVMDHAYWGKSYGTGETTDWLRSANITHEVVDDEDRLLDRVVESLTRGEVVGWHQGRFEWGPRALGCRSILADARRADMKDIVNTKIKFREPYRPFAPSVVAEAAERYFELPDACRHYPARFMLLVVPVRTEHHATLPAITHVDGSGRLQTVFRDSSPLYYSLIERFGKATGVPVVLNTSFNLKGEPIVNTPANAHNTFVKSDMDLLVLGNVLVRKR